MSFSWQKNVMKRVTLFELSGRMDSMSLGGFEQTLLESIQNDHAQVVLSMYDVEYIASTGLRIILTARKQAMKGDGDVHIANPSDRVREKLEMAGLDEILKIYDNQVEAVGSFENPKLRENKPSHLFISYSHLDKENLIQLREYLTEHKIAVWTDEHLIPGTDDWLLAVETAIDKANCVILLLSPEARESQWVRKEITYAQESQLPIIPFWIKGDNSKVKMLSLSTAQRIDARKDMPNALNLLLKAIQNYASKSS
jgi:anti-sigma B factor antagonist